MSKAYEIRDIINRLNTLAEGMESVNEIGQASIANTNNDENGEDVKAKEASVITKMSMLARNGLVDSKDVSRLITAFRALEQGRPLGTNLRLVLLQTMKSLTDLISDDPTLVSRIRQDLMKQDTKDNVVSPPVNPN